jgi:hypothetical protein
VHGGEHTVARSLESVYAVALVELQSLI